MSRQKAREINNPPPSPTASGSAHDPLRAHTSRQRLPQNARRTSSSLPLAEEASYEYESRFAPLLRTSDSGTKKEGILRLFSALGGIFLVKKIELKNLFAWIMTYHYVPIFAILLALCCNCLVHIFFSLIFPIVHNELDVHTALSEAFPTYYRNEVANATAWTQSDLFRKIARVTHSDEQELYAMVRSGLFDFFTLGKILMLHVGVFLGVVIIGYKSLCLVLDAAFDSCRVVRHPLTRGEMLFYDGYCDLRHIWLQGNFYIFLFFSFIAAQLGVTFLCCFTSFIPGFEWASRDKNVFFLALSITSFQVLWITYQLLRMRYPSRSSVLNKSKRAAASSSSTASLLGRYKHLSAAQRQYEEIVAVWWSRKLPKIRHRGFLSLAAFAAFYTFCDRGMMYGLTCLAEGLVYLNLIHIVMLVAAKLTIFVKALIFSLRTLPYDTAGLIALVITTVPFVTLCSFNLLFFSRKAAALQIPPLLLLIRGIASHSRQQQQQKQQSSSLRTAFKIALSTILGHQRQSTKRSVHYNYARFFRVALRLTLTCASLVVVLLGGWVSFQLSPRFARPVGTTCEEGANSSTIVLKASLMDGTFVGHSATVDADASTTAAEPSLSSSTNNPRYLGLCGRRWASLHAADLAFYSLLSYVDPTSPDFIRMFTFYKTFREGAESWTRHDIDHTFTERARLHADDEPLPSTAILKRRLHHFRDPKTNVSIIAIRGTEPTFAADLFQNVLMFSEVFIFQAMSNLVPGVGLIPEALVREFIAFASVLESMMMASTTQDHYYYRRVREYVAAFREVQTAAGINETIIITGHSLGGVVAQMVGAMERVDAVAFSSPGISRLERKYAIDPDDLDGYTTNVVVNNDIVPLIGRLSGNVHNVQCEHARADLCHSVELQFLRLWSVCDDYRALVRVTGSYVVNRPPFEVWSRSVSKQVSAFMEEFWTNLGRNIWL